MPDSNWSSRRLLLHFDGSNGSTTFTDSSVDARTVTAVGSAALTTSAQKWGTASLSLNGISGRATASLPAFAGDFTIECWAYLLTAGGSASRAAFTLTPFEVYRVGSGEIRLYKDGAGTVITGSTLALDTWHHIALSRSGTTMRLFVNGTLQASAITDSTSISAGTIRIGSYSDGTEVWQGYLDDFRVSDRAEYTANFTAPTAAFEDGDGAVPGRLSSPGPLRQPALLGGQSTGRLSTPGPLRSPAIFGGQWIARLSTPGPLGQPALVGTQRYARLSAASPLGDPRLVAVQQAGRLSAPSPLGAAALRGSQGFGRLSAAGPLGAARLLVTFPVVGQLSAPGPLGAASVLAFSDFTGQVSETSTLSYVADIITPGGTVRVPISSWQATLDTAGAGYVQCVVPACAEWIDTLITGTEFVISRRATLTNGAAIEYEMARSPIEVRSYAQGPRNYTATISGYPDALTPNASPPTAYDRTLTGVRTVTDGGDGGIRVRADIDWLLRPGMRAYYGATEILVDFINYYVPGNDQYMDIGERA